MGSVIVVMGIIGALVLVAYLQFPPAFANKKLVSVFDKMVLAVCALLCLAWFWNIRTTWMGTSNDKWWQPVALFGSLAIETTFLGVCFLLRNFWIFKPPRRPGGGGWF